MYSRGKRFVDTNETSKSRELNEEKTRRKFFFWKFTGNVRITGNSSDRAAVKTWKTISADLGLDACRARHLEGHPFSGVAFCVFFFSLSDAKRTETFVIFRFDGLRLVKRRWTIFYREKLITNFTERINIQNELICIAQHRKSKKLVSRRRNLNYMDDFFFFFLETSVCEIYYILFGIVWFSSPSSSSGGFGL